MKRYYFYTQQGYKFWVSAKNWFEAKLLALSILDDIAEKLINEATLKRINHG